MKYTWLSRYAGVLAGATLAVACSGKPKPVEPEVLWNTEDVKEDSPSTSSPTAPPRTLSVEEACSRFKALSAEGCEWTERFPAEFTEGDTCETSLATWVDPQTPNHASLESTIGCWALNCDAAIPCMTSAQQQGSTRNERKCGDEGTTPIEVDAETWEARRGAGAKRFADVQTSVDEPVEACGIDGEIEWMASMTCVDGSNPYESPSEINQSRDAWFERGGRCNSVLDRYTVRCPESEYTIYVDRYVCPAN